MKIRYRGMDKVVYRLKNGKAPILIVRYDRNEKKVFYIYFSEREGFDFVRCLGPSLRGPRDFDDFVPYEGPLPDENSVEPESNWFTGEYEPKENDMSTDLYQTKTEPHRFGTKIAVNSTGQFVLEMKGEGGKVEAFNEADIELVLPYSVSLSRLSLTADRSHETTIHVLTEPGKVQLDDILLELNSGIIWRVVQLDSKVKNPKTNASKWLRMPCEKLTFGE